MQEKSKLERIFTTTSIALTFVVVGLLVFAFMQVLPLNRFFLDVLLILAIVCFGCVSSLSAVKMLSADKKNVFAYVILGMTGFVCLLWVIFVFVGRGLVDSLASTSSDMSHLANAWGYTRTVIFLTIQVSLANLVLTNIYNFKKSFLPFQIIMYASNFIVDLWVSIVILSLNVGADGFVFTANWLLDSAFFATLFVLAMVFTWVAGGILRKINRNRMRDMAVEALVATKIIENKLDSIEQEKATEPQQEQPVEQEVQVDAQPVEAQDEVVQTEEDKKDEE